MKNSLLKEKDYILYESLPLYKNRYFTTNICEPPITMQTSLDDYPEFDIFAQIFIKKYGFNSNDFIQQSLTKNFLKQFIDKSNPESVYKDLCYLGLIQQRVYLLRGFTKIEDREDPAYNPCKVHKVMKKILNYK